VIWVSRLGFRVIGFHDKGFIVIEFDWISQLLSSIELWSCTMEEKEWKREVFVAFTRDGRFGFGTM
jgi:hypothetical protein